MAYPLLVKAAILPTRAKTMSKEYFRLWSREQEEFVQAKDGDDAAASSTDADDKAESRSPRAWRLLPSGDGSPKLEEVAGNDPMTEFMVEMWDKRCMWPRGTAVTFGRSGVKLWDDSSFDEAAWRSSLEVGSRVDCLDCDGVWQEGIVAKVIPMKDIEKERSESNVNMQKKIDSGEDEVATKVMLEHGAGRSEDSLASMASDEKQDLIRVQFRAWGPRFDEFYRRSSWRMQPAWSRIRNFRNFKVGHRVVMMKPHSENNARKWYDVKVKSVDDEAKKVTLVALQQNDAEVTDKTFELDFDSDRIAPVGTHLAENLAKATPKGIEEAQLIKAAAAPATSSSLYSSSSAMTSRSGRGYSSLDTSYSWRRNRDGTPDTPGAVGLMNLGKNVIQVPRASFYPFTMYSLHFVFMLLHKQTSKKRVELN